MPKKAARILARIGCSGMKRRTFVATGLAALAGISRGKAARVSMAEAFDREMEAFMKARAIPGGSLAVVKDRRLVYARGYGLADRDKNLPVQADSLFRIASISKPFTAVAVMKLIEEGKLTFDQRALDILGWQTLKRGDDRLWKVTIRQLLQHTGGWNRDPHFDPMFRSRKIAKATGTPSPAQPEAIIRFMLGERLDFDPGTQHVYSNFGYCMLGRVIEKITGRTYEAYVREAILAPMGIRRMRIGASLDGKQASGEVRYYTPDDGAGESVFDDGAKVPFPYGGFCLEAMDAHGGWIASAVDLARFAAALDDPAQCPVLNKESLASLYEPPPPPVSRKEDGSLADSFYGCGWMVRPVGKDGRANYWHDGSLPGSATLLVRRWDGLSWVVLFNQRSEDPQLPDGAIDAALHRAADATAEWPSENLFDQSG